MAKYMIDTTTFSAMMKRDPIVYAKVGSLDPADSLIICPNVRGEILFGVQKLPEGKRKTELASKAWTLLGAIESRDITDPIADEYARIKNESKTKGKQLSDNDIWIAAAAVQHNAVIVAADRDFSRLSQLSAEDWTKQA